MRGNPVRCVGYFGAPRAFTVIDRKARGMGFATVLQDSIDVPGDSSRYRWYGTAIASTSVSIRVVFRDTANHVQRLTGTATFAVQPRPALDPTFTKPRAQLDSLVVDMTAYPFVRTGPGTFAAVWGYYFGPFNSPAGFLASDIQFTIGRGSGPNGQLFYWTKWPTLPDSSISYVHPALSGASISSKWYNEQTGPEPGKCNKDSGIVRTLNETKRHEGVTMSNDSHFGLMRAFVQSEAVAVQMERPYAIDSVALISLTQGMIDRITKKQVKVQKAFDRTEYKVIFGRQAPDSRNFGRIMCRMVFDSTYIDSLAGVHP